MNTMGINLLRACALALCCALAPVAAQEAFPGKSPIEITVLFPAGSSADVTARALADGMARALGATVLVVDRPGAGGAIGYRYVAAQKPDGHALVWNSNSISTTYHSGQLAFDYRSFDAVARVLVESPLLAVKSDSPWKTLADFIDDAKSRPGKISVGNSGVGSHTHISSVALFRAAGVSVIDVPFAGAQVVPSLIGGHVDAMVQLAALTANRDPNLPDVPTAREQGYDVALDAWRGIAVPKGTPKPVIEALESAIRNTVASREFTSACEKFLVKPAFAPADEFASIIANEDAELAKLMSVIGMKKN